MPLTFVEITPEIKSVSADSFTLTCLQCGAQWIRRGPTLPKSCSNRKCHSTRWQESTAQKKKKIYTKSIFDLEKKEDPEILIEQNTEKSTAEKIKFIQLECSQLLSILENFEEIELEKYTKEVECLCEISDRIKHEDFINFSEKDKNLIEEINKNIEFLESTKSKLNGVEK